MTRIMIACFKAAMWALGVKTVMIGAEIVGYPVISGKSILVKNTFQRIERGENERR